MRFLFFLFLVKKLMFCLIVWFGVVIVIFWLLIFILLDFFLLILKIVCIILVCLVFINLENLRILFLWI